MFKKILFIVSAAILVSCGKEKEKPTDKKTAFETTFDTTQLDKQLDSVYKLGHFNGLGVAIVNKETIIYENGFGYADVATQKKYTPQTHQNIASISKVMLGLTLLKAIEQEKLELDENINKYLPFTVTHPVFPATPIKISHLVNHTSGITDADYYDYAYINIEKNSQNDPSIDQEELIYFRTTEDQKTLSDYLEYGLSINDSLNKDYIYNNTEPGSTYEYSNIAAGLTAFIIENAVKEDFKTYSKREVIDALGLKKTSWNPEELDTSLRSTIYSNLKLRYPKYDLVTYADGGLYTSVHDLGIVLSEILAAYHGEGTLLEKSSYQTFFEKTLKPSHLSTEENAKAENKNQNHGVFISYEHERIGHTGGDPGVATVMFFKPENDFGIIYFVNTDMNSQEGVDTFVGLTTLLEKSQEKNKK